jgi:hypothetical protein
VGGGPFSKEKQNVFIEAGGSNSKALEEELVEVSPSLQETQIKEEEEASEDEYDDEEVEDRLVEGNTRFMNEIKLRELKVLRRMAEQGADSRGLRKELRNVGASPRQQS